MQKRKLQVWLPLLFSLTMIAGIYFGYKMRDGNPGKSFFYLEKRRPIQEIMDLIEKKYVDQVDLNKLGDTAIRSMLLQLDPHSVFIPANEVDRVNEELAGRFYGIGIEFNMFNDTLNVIHVIKDGPGFSAGIKTGDKFIKADGHLLSGVKLTEDSTRKLLKGGRGSIVSIDILREQKSLNIRIKRDVVNISNVDAAYMVDPVIGYIRLNIFSQQTYKEFMQNLESLKKKGLKKLVLDLRDNGGGVLDEAVEIADEFLSGEKLITYTEGKHFPKKEFRCRREGQFENGDLVVLCNEGTASASEVLIGALQDWDRAIIVGRRTFGKGLVQDQFDLSDKSALRLTVARYYTPIGRSIQRSFEKGTKAYYEEIGKRFIDGETFSTDSIPLDSGTVFKTPAGKKVYGGGGISPDYFVAADSVTRSKNISNLFSKGLLSEFGYKYYLLNKSLLSGYKSPAEFAASFTINGESWKMFQTISLDDSIDLTGLMESEKIQLIKYMKLAIARQVWQNEGYYEVLNTSDNTVKKALSLLINK